MKNTETFPPSQSGQEVAKQNGLLNRRIESGQASGQAKPSSKFSAAFWVTRIYRPTYTRQGMRHEISEWYARIQHGRRREQIGLQTNDRQEGARKAARLYQLVRTQGWASVLAEFRPDVETAAARDLQTVGD